MQKTPPAAPSANAQKWDNAYLNKMRLSGDPTADKAARSLFTMQDDISIYSKLGQIAKNSSYKDIPGLSPELLDFFEQAQVIPEHFKFHTKDESGLTGEEKIRIAADVFDRYGFYVIALLFFKSLPTGYMAPYPSKVLAVTQLIKENPTRRLLETAQMIFDVLKPGWYDKDNGAGIASILKVRLMHAGMRLALTNGDQAKWDAHSEDPIKGIPLGLPINQEDKILTLNVFSIIIMEGLEQLGITLTPVERDAYYYNWRLVGYYIGIDEELNPTTIDDCWYLQKTIEKRLYHENNPDGATLTKALLGVITNHLPAKKEGSYKIIEDCTLYLLKFPQDNPMVAKSLGLHSPNKFELFLNKVATTILGKLDNTKKEVMTFGQKLKKRNSYLSTIVIVLVTPLRIKNLAYDKIKMGLFKHLCQSLMMQLQQQATLSSSRPAFSDHSELLTKWQLDSFDLDVPFLNSDESKAGAQKVIRYASLVVAPGICVFTLTDLYTVQVKHEPPLLAHFLKQEGMMLKGTIPSHFTAEMLGVSIVFAGVTVLVYMAMFRKKPKYFNYAYMLIVAGILFWVMTLGGYF
jgi:hypothetical protein